MEKIFHVYLLTNTRNTVLYTGVTSHLSQRIHQHKNKLIDGFIKKYNCHKLVYFEETTGVESAIRREKQLKGWTRLKKEKLIAAVNPGWEDLSAGWYE